MSTAVFPSLIGLGWDIVRKVLWDNDSILTSVSGKETRIGYWTYPKYRWELSFEFLQSDQVNLELQDLIGFFNLMNGRFDSFQYTDPTDNAVVGQTIGVGDGSTVDFQLIRSMGGFVEPIFAPNNISALYLDGVPSVDWTVANWGSATPGVVTMNTAPGSGVVISVDMTFYWPCRFSDKSLDFNNFMVDLWAARKVGFESIK